MGRALLVALGATIAAMGPAVADDPPKLLKGEALVSALLEFVEEGSLGAQLLLGSLYDTGQQGVPEDDAEAVRWYRMAAEQGLAEAQVNLGVMYDNGGGVPEDDAEAARWYRLAAEQGHPKAQLSLAIQYITGEGVSVDQVQAYAWLNLAATGGDPDAGNVRASLVITGSLRVSAANPLRDLLAQSRARRQLPGAPAVLANHPFRGQRVQLSYRRPKRRTVSSASTPVRPASRHPSLGTGSRRSFTPSQGSSGR